MPMLQSVIDLGAYATASQAKAPCAPVKISISVQWR